MNERSSLAPVEPAPGRIQIWNIFPLRYHPKKSSSVALCATELFFWLVHIPVKSATDSGIIPAGYRSEATLVASYV
mgnify:CR=1 FL=1